MISAPFKLPRTASRVLLAAASVSLFTVEALAAPKEGKDTYYTVPPIFLPAPSSVGGKAWNVKNFGPVGIGITLKPQNPGFQMVISNVEKGSPAEATGKLKKGQVIESINGRVLKDRDPRMILGDIVTQAEATDGKVALKIKDAGDVVVQIPVMGSYSETWPLNCPKSDRIVRNLADLLAKQEKPGWGSVLFLLSTGEEKDLDVVRNWMGDLKTLGAYQWHIGYHGIGVCEYYLRTGDESVLPMIREAAESLRKTMYNGGWSGRGNPANFTYSTGSGQMHAAGVHCMSFLMLARMCGVEVDDYMFNTALSQFYRFAGHGNLAYGDTWPEGGFRDNGKTGGLAVAMAYAARLTPGGEASVYAKARDNSAMKSFYATNWFHAAHTGGGIGEIWHHAAMGLMHEKRPTPYRSYLDTRRWVMDLSRRHDGGIGIAGMEDRYDVSATEGDPTWGTLFALTYTYPRKTLQLTGAPKTQWCKTHQLPAHPWGNANDDVFQSPEPARHPSISMDDLMRERVETDASLGVFGKLGDPDITDEELLKYVHHPEFDIRSAAMARIVAYNRDHLIAPLLKSKDPRLRDAGVMALAGMFKGNPLPDERITPEMLELAGAMVDAPDESWWVTIGAMKALQRAKPPTIARHVDRLLVLLESENWWVSSTAAKPLAVLATDPRYCKRILPPLLKTVVDSDTCAGLNEVYSLTKRVNSANPEVKAFATQLLETIYAGLPGEYREPSNGLLIPGRSGYVRKCLASMMQNLPGGEKFIRTRPKMTLAAKLSGRKEDMYVYSGTFIPNKGLLGQWIRLGGVDDPGKLPGWVADWKKRGSQPVKSVYSFSLADGGRIKGEGFLKKMGQEFFWSGDMMIGLNSNDEARRMMVKTVDGVDFLLVEKGGFGAIGEGEKSKPVPKDWHCGYQIHIRGGQGGGKGK
ncbi:MAG: DUF6288 domain-containing protein [Lentisphaeria bacterium]|nr:DUF6288 domain-containing protein [Lentisphaeria bacterium]